MYQTAQNFNIFLHNRWRGDLGQERRDWVGVELEEEFTGGGSGTFKVYFYVSV
jgi:hypothetical protein